MLTWKTEEIVVCGIYSDCGEMNANDNQKVSLTRTMNCQSAIHRGPCY